MVQWQRHIQYRQLRARRALSLYKVYGINALLVLSWRYQKSSKPTTVHCTASFSHEMQMDCHDDLIPNLNASKASHCPVVYGKFFYWKEDEYLHSTGHLWGIYGCMLLIPIQAWVTDMKYTILVSRTETHNQALFKGVLIVRVCHCYLHGRLRRPISRDYRVFTKTGFPFIQAVTVSKQINFIFHLIFIIFMTSNRFGCLPAVVWGELNEQ